MGRRIALVDCNNFFASCERLVDPSLVGKPVVVLSNNDGCVIARSNEAKLLGIPMGVPYHQHKRQFESAGVHVFSSNYRLYKTVSDHVMDVLSEFAPGIEFYSIDEAFLDLSGIANVCAYAHEIREGLKARTGIPVSIGVASSKTLAKMANHYAKHSDKANGMLVLDNPRHLEIALRRLPVGDVWGMGWRLADKLKAIGIQTAWDLSRANDKMILKKFNVVLLRTVHELRGQSRLPLVEAQAANRMIMSSLSFGRPIEQLSELYEPLANYMAYAAAKMRRQGSAARTVSVFLQTNRHSRREPYWKNAHEIQLPRHTICTQELTQAAMLALEQIFEAGRRYHKLGIVLQDLIPSDGIQQSLFDTRDRARQERLMEVLDGINGHYGPGALRYAIEGTRKRWRNRGSFLSDADPVLKRLADCSKKDLRMFVSMRMENG